ncbi:MAG: FIST C-terminal domain-containing protein [Planctomycetaceae bacterium]|jgi:hypothetical protein|nr:FIST C-terminal domain-containing protein [Planctomycetaceae bacterium]
MLDFFSARTRSVNGERAALECIEVAFPNGIRNDCRCIVFNVTLGHKPDRIADVMSKTFPGVPIYGASGCAVTGREGIGESMHELGIMAVCGPENEIASASVKDIYGDNSYEKALELAKALHKQNTAINCIYLVSPGIDINNTLILKAFVDVFGETVTIFGGTSSDNMRGALSLQYHSGVLAEHDAFAVGFADPTLRSITRGTHGFVAYGDPMIATKAKGHRVFEFNGKGAWTEFTRRLEKPVESTCGDTIPVGAIAEELPAKLAEEYGSPHILRVVTKHDGETLLFPTTVTEGTKFWLTTRDEKVIFSEQKRTLEYMTAVIGSGKPAAVFQTDCLARGRFLFNRIVKDEIIAMMQAAFSVNGEVPPWLGNYGFGEYAKLGGLNTYHNYSTALLVLYRG